MSTPRNLTPQQLTTANVLMQVYLLAVQFEDAMTEITSTKNDRHIALARGDMLQPNWGTLLDIGFDQTFTVDQYRDILLGLTRARLAAPSKSSLRQTVLSFAPSANVVIRDYFNDSANFSGPDPATFFTTNVVAAGNVWNNPGTIWKPGQLLKLLGFDPFGTQVQVVNLGSETDIPLLHFVPAALEFVKPAHQFVALIYSQEIAGP